jgi:lipopolysaccharide cholinephosphotransferase
VFELNVYILFFFERFVSCNNKMPKLKETKASVVKMLYQLMYDVHQILTNNGIQYFSDGGTTLGAVRHEGIIPWDDDLDIGIMKKDRLKFLALKSSFAKCGYSIGKWWGGYKVYYTRRKKMEDFDYSFPFCDVIFYEKVGNNVVQSSKAVRDAWPKYWYKEKELFPLEMAGFGDFDIFIPNKPEKYLKRSYGSDWNDIAYREYDHQAEEAVESIKVKLTKKMREPAEPTDKIKNRLCVKACIKKSRSKKKLRPRSWEKKSTKRCSRSGGCYNNFDTKMGVYVINCSMHKTRYNKFLKHSSKAGVKACRVPCTLGKKFSDALLCEMIKTKVLKKNADMTNIEVSINMSHYNCWKRLVNSCLDYALVVEDDVELKPGFVKQVNNIMGALGNKDIDFSILHLWNGNWADTVSSHKKVMKVGNLQIVQEMTDYNAGAAAYIISKEYAQWLMNHFFPIKMPQDILMGTYYKKGKHLSLKMKYRSKDSCYISPLLSMDCGGPGGTGGQTTQTYNAPTIARLSCKKC